jgi:restriction endonuclease Mrr
MDSEKFELFSAAVVMGLGQGYTFKEHCGRSGDHGIDVKLRNAYGMRVGVQSKFYTPGNSTVGSDAVREFWGSLTFYQAIHGYFVTTSTFIPAAQQVIESTSGYIRIIDGQQLDTYLQWQSREIALAWREVQELNKSTGTA